ncbi:11563_t:CDS:2, partial [Racocetra persica]
MTKRDIQAALEQQEEKSDEKYFCLIRPNPHQYVWRIPHKEFDDDCLVLAIKSKGDQYPNSNGIFQHDGASVHRSKIVKRYLANKDIKTYLYLQ